MRSETLIITSMPCISHGLHAAKCNVTGSLLDLKWCQDVTVGASSSSEASFWYVLGIVIGNNPSCKPIVDCMRLLSYRLSILVFKLRSGSRFETRALRNQWKTHSRGDQELPILSTLNTALKAIRNLGPLHSVVSAR